ncbi:hypothetical protein NECID01_0494 [Nematocida sp. AWRm77]|nr:hypothetical protein NECID01_0494 [Nematocida sp. AWRm77]
MIEENANPEEIEMIAYGSEEEPAPLIIHRRSVFIVVKQTIRWIIYFFLIVHFKFIVYLFALEYKILSTVWLPYLCDGEPLWKRVVYHIHVISIMQWFSGLYTCLCLMRAYIIDKEYNMSPSKRVSIAIDVFLWTFLASAFLDVFWIFPQYCWEYVKTLRVITYEKELLLSMGSFLMGVDLLTNMLTGKRLLMVLYNIYEGDEPREQYLLGLRIMRIRRVAYNIYLVYFIVSHFFLFINYDQIEKLWDRDIYPLKPIEEI